jgi:lipopolysaccharide biosynthesis protein
LSSPRLVAFHLPQFHPTPENDEWWGPGFTEWTNVAKARPLFPGHDQPHLPADLGFYDLRLQEARRAQADLARQYGISAFCYHYYWFSGRRLLDEPLVGMLRDPGMEMPFCLSWANENWTRRWDGRDREVLIAQDYAPDNARRFIEDALPFLADPRYLRHEGRPLLVVYRPQAIPEVGRWLDVWREHALRTGLGELHLCGALTHDNTDVLGMGFDSGVEFPPHNARLARLAINDEIPFADPMRGFVVRYRDFADEYLRTTHAGGRVFRTVVPRWDNTPRLGDRGLVLAGSSPHNYGVWLQRAIELAEREQHGAEQLVFVNAWNEWAEGCHLEPDQRHGRSFLEVTRQVLDGRWPAQASDWTPDIEGQPAPPTFREDLRRVLASHALRRRHGTQRWLSRHPRLYDLLRRARRRAPGRGR